MAEVVFLGDDFTGASDTLATYARKGWPARLVLNPSGATDGLAALGLATDLRAQAVTRGSPVIDALRRKPVQLSWPF